MRRALMLALAILALSVLSGCIGNLKSNRDCVPECSGNECGSDGCGGTCGACGPGLTCSSGSCVSTFCGNGRIEEGEICDPMIPAGANGACATECVDDGNACTTQRFFGSPSDCDAQCRVTRIIDCIDDDGCCPEDCLPESDTDCSTSCGNGTLEGAETCDPPESCPTLEDCDDNDACTRDELAGRATTCSAECLNIPLGADDCEDDDGCCPPGCGVDDDNDCDFVCGDGQVTGSELCDSAIAALDEGFCPTDAAAHCDDDDACTTNEILGSADDCSAQCINNDITDFIDDDGCCPPGGTPDTDNDCMAVCGNNVVEAGETCDSAIPAGDDGYCPADDTECDDMDSCTINTMIGAVDDCTAECETTDVMMPTPEDGCCYFAGIVADEIVDCQSMCDDYCTAAITNCPDAPIYVDENASGDAMDECQAACAAFTFPVGPPPGVDAADDIDGNTLTCRIVHLGLADPNDAATQMTHCPHAEAVSDVCNVDL